MRCRLWLTLAGIFLSLIAALPVTAQGAKARSSINSALVAFDASPFPYTGDIPEQNVPFLQNDEAGAFHLAPRAGKLREATYADKRSLLAIPSGFDPNRAGAKLVLFFHGNLATLERVETLQRVPQQLAASHLDAVLVAPQMAKSALDSSAGHFWERGFFDTYLDEAAKRLADRSHGAFDAAAIARLPVVIVAYSGGYLPTAFSLLYAQGGAGRHRIEGVVLLDALFAEEAKFATWIGQERGKAFFISLYSKSTNDLNTALAHDLRAAERTVDDTLPARIDANTIAIVPRLAASHDLFVTMAGVADPLADVLRRIGGGASLR